MHEICVWVGHAVIVTFLDARGGAVSFSKTIKKKKKKIVSTCKFGTQSLFLKFIACKQQQQQQQPNVHHNNKGYVYDNRIFISSPWDAVRR